MATLSIYNHFAKKFTNKTSGTKMTWWKTSFNMPVPNIYDNNSSYSETEWMLNATGEATSFDLSGFEAGNEIVMASTVFSLRWPFAGGTINVTQNWKSPGGTVLVTNGPVGVGFGSLPDASYWQSYQLGCNIGVASWEVSGAGTYSLDGVATGAITQTTNFPVTFSNVPSVSTYTPGMMWVEWNNLRWTSANWHVHTRTGTDMWAAGASPWFIWLYWSYIYWTWTNGHKYVGPYNFKQFASAFSNGPSPGVVSGQTPGFMWMDNNFGYEHVGYIAQDGYKWIMPAGDDPYA